MEVLPTLTSVTFCSKPYLRQEFIVDKQIQADL